MTCLLARKWLPPEVVQTLDCSNNLFHSPSRSLLLSSPQHLYLPSLLLGRLVLSKVSMQDTTTMICCCFLFVCLFLCIGPVEQFSNELQLNRPFPSSPEPLFQNKSRCSAFDMEIIFHSHANKTRFHKKGCVPSLILKVRVFGTRKWPFDLGKQKGE